MIQVAPVVPFAKQRRTEPFKKICKMTGHLFTAGQARVQQVQVNMTHHQWVQSLVDSKNPADKSFAKEMLGPTRFDLVKSGKLTVDRLYYGGKKITIADLKKEYIK